MSERVDPVLARLRARLDKIAREEADKSRANGPETAVADWKKRWQLTDKGKPFNNFWNATLALLSDPAWAGRLRWDDMLRKPVGPDGPLEDPQIFDIHRWLQQVGLRSLGLGIAREAVEWVCHQDPFHPLFDELLRLEAAWDETARLAEWPCTYLGAEPGEPVHSIGTMFMVAMVARIFEPGCKADYMLVLEGPQGKKKSQACQILAGRYFSDQLPDLSATADHVRLSMHLRGKWIIEVPELSAFSTTDARKLKSFLTGQVERFTPKFAHHEVEEPRQCLFVGTTNDDTYLRDPTGGRRFWPVKCGTIDLGALKRDRDLLIGEAVHRYRDRVPWWPEEDFEERYLKPLQDSRFESDPWETPIADKLAGRFQVTTFEVARDLLGLPESQIGTLATRRVTAILKALGWSQVRSNKQRFWTRTPP